MRRQRDDLDTLARGEALCEDQIDPWRRQNGTPFVHITREQYHYEATRRTMTVLTHNRRATAREYPCPTTREP